MKYLLKLGLTALVILFFTGCGGGGSSNNGDAYQEGDHITQFMSDFPTLDTSGFTLIKEERAVTYYDNSSADLAVAMNITLVNEKDFNIISWNYADINDFWYGYELNNPTFKGLEYAEAYVEYYNPSSYAYMYLEANRTISNSEFADVFGDVDDDLLLRMYIDSRYEGDMSAKFTDYYTEVTKVGGFFDISDANVQCDTDSWGNGPAIVYSWYCEKRDLEGDKTIYYSFSLRTDGILSYIGFDKGFGY
ncbi:MAG: hypothetical protein LBL65_07895 [Campylobacteraceae bacterium]|jgi:hypothetical protein|nr:hypothetical protein [Campylobacteraceae bacterium]